MSRYMPFIFAIFVVLGMYVLSGASNAGLIEGVSMLTALAGSFLASLISAGKSFIDGIFSTTPSGVSLLWLFLLIYGVLFLFFRR
jgi:hypothetical protein